jgi:hypothetical protein
MFLRGFRLKSVQSPYDAGCPVPRRSGGVKPGGRKTLRGIHTASGPHRGGYP